MRKHGFRLTTCLFLVALGVAAFADASLAVNLNNGGTNGKFKVEGLFTLTPNTTFTGQFEQLTNKSSVHFVYLLPSANASFLCASTDIEEGKFISESEALIKAKLLGCAFFRTTTKGEEVEEVEKLPACAPKDGSVIFAYKLLAKLHESELYVLSDGDLLKDTAANLELGEECAFGELLPLTGSFVGKVKEGTVEQVTKLIEFTEAIQLLFQERNGGVFVAGDRFQFGNMEAFAEGNMTLSLTGMQHLNKKWSVH